MKKFTFLKSLVILTGLIFGIYVGGVNAQVTVSGAVSGNGTYTTLGAAFTAINGGVQTGAVISISITASTNEGATTALLNANSWTSLTIQPSGGAWTITGAPAAGSQLIDFSGADNVTIDGLNSGGSSLVISNTTVSATSGTCTIRFIGGATNNTITRCSILGSATMAVGTNGGNIYFATDANTANGNDNNTISFCNIGPAGSNLPSKGIYGNGTTTTTAINNSGITITDNNIFDVFAVAVTSAGIYIGGGCTDWTISNNKFYQTATRTQTTSALHSPISIVNTTSGNNFLVSGNIIGYSSSSGTGTYTINGVSNTFRGIYLSLGTTTASSVQGNTFTNISQSTAASGTSSSSPCMMIYIGSGLVNVGNITGNIIGSMTSTGAISYTSSSTSTSDVNVIFNFGSSAFTCSNNSIGGITAANSSTGAANIYGIRYNTGSGVTSTIQNNIIGGTIANSIQSTTTSTSSAVNGILAANANSTITGNIVRNLTAAGGTGTSSSSSVVGISCSSSSVNNTVSQNVIHTLTNTNSSAAVSVIGMYYTASSGTNLVSRNFIHSLNVASATGLMSGIHVGGGTTTYQNNMIRLGIDASGIAITTGCAINGINEPLGTDNFYFNSIFIGGTGVGGSSSTFAFNSTQTTNTRSFRNNIFYNARSNGAGTGKHYAVQVGGTTVNPTGLTVNNNDYLANGTGSVFGRFNALDVLSLDAWRTAVGQDAGSFSYDPQYITPGGTSSTVDLHISASNPTPVEGSGFDIASVTDDFDGQTRSSLGPVDIGADAGVFVMLDISAPTIAYTPLANTSSTLNRTITVTITDASGIPTSGIGLPTLYWKIGAGSYSAVQGVSIGSNQYTFTFGAGVVLADIVSYYIVAQDNATALNVGAFPSVGASGYTVNPPAVSTAPTTPSTYTILGSICGSKTIGASGADYTTITAAVADLNTKEITCPVVFNLIDATYPTETFPITINANSGSSAVNTVTIKPASGVTSTITGSSANALIIINGADYISIDGSNNGSNSRNLTLVNTNTGTSSTLIWLQNTATPDAATYNTIKNCILTGSGNTQTLFGLGSGSSTISTSSLGIANNNNSFINNNISKTQYGIYSQGASAANKNQGTVIKDNLMNTTSPNNVAKGGIQVGFENNITISGNTIDGITQTTSNDVFGITLGLTSFTLTTYTGNEVTNATVNNNTIGGVTHTSTYSAVGIAIAPATSGTNNINNNVIYGVGCNGTSGDYASGILAGGGSGSTTNIFYNSISMTGTFTGGGQPVLGIAVGGTNPVVNIKNNISYVTQTNGGGKQYAIGLAYSSPFNNLSCNYNDLYAAGSLGFSSTGGLGTTDATTLALWTAATGQDINSLSVVPLFNSLTNLRCQPTSTVLSMGTPVSVTTDILGLTRSVTTPSMGAYELGYDLTGPVIAYTALTNTSSLANRILTATISDASGVPTSGAGLPMLYWKIGAGAYTGVQGVSLGSDQFSFTFGSGVVATDVVSYYIVAQDNAGTPNISAYPATGASGFTISPPAASTAPTTPSTYTILGTICGTKTIGASGADYTTITAAVADLNAKEITCPVIFNLIDATYPTETYPITINANTGSSAVNTVTIKPASGITSAITGSSASSIFKINGADYIIIDGSNNGSSSKNLSITNTNSGTSSAVLWHASASASDAAINNTIKNCILSGNTTTTTLMGIFSGGTASISTSGNALANNNGLTIQNNTISKAQYGIFVIDVSTSSLGSGLTVSGNTMGSSTAGDGFNISGIDIRYQNGATISNNDIQNISTTSANDIKVINILDDKLCTINGNKVHNINYTGSSTYKVYGITTSSATFNVVGNPSANTYYNNLVYQLTSTATSSSWNTSGINNNGGYGDKYYYNSVYLSGQMSGTGGTGGSAAFSNGNGISSTNCAVIELKNNIFQISGSSTAAASLYSHYTTLTTYVGSVILNNSLYSTATGSAIAKIGRFNATEYTDFALWSNATGETASLNINPQFISTTDLRCQLGSPVLAAGTPIGGITTDILGTTRSLTTPSMGAYENGIDLAGPTISYTALSNHTSLTTRNVPSITITDPSGVNTVSGTMPRLYFKRSTNTNAFNDNTSATDGWKYVEANGTTSPFDFTIDYSLLNGAAVALGDIIQYFVVAQDIQGTPFISINSGTFAAAPVSVALTSAAFPIGGTINQYTIVAPISGTFNIPSGTYKSLTDNATGQPGSPGIFQMINNSALNGDITIIIDGDLIETGTNALNQFSEVLPGNYTIYINSDGTSRTISQTVGGIAVPMINFNGADRVTIDGGASKNLTFRNTHATPATAKAAIQFINGATSNILTNCNIESNASTTTQGAVLISTGTNNVQITANNIHDATGGTTGNPSTGIYSGSTTNTLTISNNSVYNFTGTGIYLFSAGDGCSITGNSLFNNLATPPSTAQTSIYLGSGNNHTVTGNYIGGQAASCGGLAWTNSGAITFTGIYSTGSSTTANTISNNTIQNISLSNTGSAPFIGINLSGGKAVASNNLIGHATTAGSINIAGTATTIGINSVNADITTIHANTLANITQSSSGSASYFDGIWIAGAANKTISNNRIYKCGPTSASTGTNSTVGIYIPGTSGTQTYTVVNNMISLGYGISNNHGIMGIDNAASTNNIILSYFNSISIGGTGTGSSATYAYLKRTSTNETLLNNNFQNERSGGTGKHYAIGSTNTSGTMSSNYNNLVATGAIGGNTGIYSSTVCLSLADWRTASSRDANSVSAVTTFTDIPNADLHASATNDCHLDGTGTDVSGFTTDFDGQTRTSPPDIGADEFTGTIPPVAVSGGNQQICFGTATPDLTASGTGTIKWYSNPGLTTLAYTGSTFATGLTAAGIYNYYVTNNFGNCASAPITITLTIDATTIGGSVGTSHAVCYGTDGGTLTLTGHTGTIVRWEYSTDAGFSWTPIVNTTTTHAVGNLTQETMFRAVVKNGLCLEVNSNPAIIMINALPIAVATNDSPKCVGEDIQFNASPNGMSSYLWSGPNFFASASQNPDLSSAGMLAAGIYSLTVTDGNSCQGITTTTVIMNPLPVQYTVEGSGTYCNGTNGKSITLSNSVNGVMYELFKSDMATGRIFAGNSGSLTWTNCLTGTYTIMAVNSTTLCGTLMSGSAVITEDPAISALVSPDPAYNQINTGLTLHGNPSGGTGVFSSHAWTGANTYLNNSGIESPVFTGTSTGNFLLTYTVTDDHGCTASDQISVAVSNPPANPVMPGQVRCGTGTLLMTATVGVGGDAVQFSLNGSDVATTDNSSPFEYTTPSVTQGTTTTIYARSINTTTGFVSSWMNAGAQADLPTVGGTASPAAPTICNNASTTINLTGQTGNVQYWERNFNGGAWTGIGNAGLTSINTGSLTPVGTYGFRAVVQNGVCSIANSTPAYVLVNQVTASAVVSNVSCNGGSNGAINLTESGGTAPYTWLWSNSQTTQDISGLTAGVYTVLVTDALGCTGTNGWTVGQPNLLTVTAVVTPVACFNGATGLINITVAGGTAPYSYSWSNSAVSEDISGLPTGTYGVTVTDFLGCTATGSWLVSQPAAAISSSASVTNVLCFNGTNGAIDMSVTGGTPGYTYLWSNGSTNQDLTGVIAGTYFVTITDSKSCILHSDYSIIQPPLLNVNAFVGNVTIPGGNNGYINLTPIGGTPGYSYHWSNNSSNQNLTNLLSGLYYVTITDQNLCTKTASYLVTEPNQINVNSNIVEPTCFGGINGSIDLSISGGTAPYSYIWSNGAVTEDISGIGSGAYTITITDFMGAIKPVSFVLSSPPAIAGSVVVTSNACYGGSIGAINLTISGGVGPYTYNWSTGASVQDISGLPAGFYVVTVTDANLCTYIHGWNVNEPSGPITFIPQTINISCYGGNDGSIDLNTIFGTAPYTYLWSNGATTEINSGLPAGTYSVTVTDANSCSKTGSWTLTQPANALSVIASNVNANCNGGASGILNAVATGGTAPYSYLWSNGLNGAYQTGIPAGTYTVTVTDFKGCTATSVTSIGQPTAIILTVNSTNVSCNGGNNGTISVTPSGGLPPYTYTWSNATYNSTVSNLLPGSYTVTVSDANFCPKIQTVNITQPTAIGISTVLTHVKCNGAATGAIVLTPTGGVGPYTYNWSNGSSNKDISGLIAGTYFVTVTDANLCTKTGNWTITQATQILSTVVQTDVNCNGGNNGALDLSVSGGVSPYTYLWSTGATSQDIGTLIAGTYTVTITDANLCQKISSWTITQPNVINPTALTTSVSCFGGANGSVNLTVTGGVGPYTYLWSTGSSANPLTGLIAGNYFVTITDAHNCTSFGNWTVTQPANPLEISAISSPVLCFGAQTGSLDLSVNGGTPAYTYLWSNGAITQDISNLPAGNYSVTVTDNNGCVAINSWNVTQPANALGATAGLTHVLCFGGNNGAVNLTVTGGTSPYSYAWSNGSPNEDINNLISGNYTVTVTDASQCVLIRTYTINQPLNPLATSALMSPVLCFGGNTGSINLSVSGGTPNYTFLWSNGAITEDISGLITGTYSVTVTDANGCVITDSKTVSQPAAAIALSPAINNVSCFGGSNGSIVLTVSGGTPAYNYVWSNGAVTKDINTLSNGTYSVTVTDANGCVKTQSFTVSQPAAALSATAIVSPVLCYNGNTGSINLTPAGGTSPYTFLWSNAATTEDISGLSAIAYTVTITDFKACTKVSSWTVSQPAAILNVTGSLTHVLCNGASTGGIVQTPVGGTSPYTYLWSDGITTKDRTSIAAGTYAVTVTDANGCTKTASYTVNQPSLLNATGIVTNVNCSGQSNGAISVTTSGGTSPYTWLWNDNNLQEDRTGLMPGNYAVTITDNNNCPITRSFSVSTNYTTPVVTMSIPYQQVCSGGLSSEVIFSSDVPGTTYSWTSSPNTVLSGFIPGGTGNIPEQTINNSGPVNSSITYNVIPTANGCQGSPVNHTITVYPVPTASINGSTTICTGSTAQLSINLTGNGPWTLTYNNGVSNISIPNITTSPYIMNVNPLVSTTYTLLSARDIHNCFGQIVQPAATITVVPKPTVSLSGNASICYGESAVVNFNLTGTPPWNLTWSDGSLHQITGILTTPYSLSIMPAVSTTISVTALSDSYCTGVNFGSPVNVLVKPLPTAVLYGSQSVCPGQAALLSVQLTGIAPWSISYTNGASVVTVNNILTSTYNFSVNPTLNTTYSLISVNDANCPGTVSGSAQVVINTLPSASLSGSAQICSGSPLTLTVDFTGTGPWTFTWFNGTSHTVSNVMSNPYSFTTTPVANTNYSITAVSDAYCSGTNFGQTLSVVVKPLPTAKILNSLSICPGSNAVLTIQLTGTAPWSVTIHDGVSTTISGITTNSFSYTVNPSVTTTYNLLSVTDANCQGTIIGNPATVSIYPVPVLNTAGINQSNTLCSGGIMTFAAHFTSGTPPFTLNYLNHQNMPVNVTNLNEGSLVSIVPPISQGAYTYNLVSITDANGCVGQINYPFVLLVFPEPIAVAGPDLTVSLGNSVTLNGMALGGTAPYQYMWNPPVYLNNPIISNPECTPLATTQYSLTVIDFNGCIGTDNMTVNVTNALASVYGTITYANTDNTPLSPVKVYVRNPQNVPVDSTITNASGFYSFANLPVGNYHLDIVTFKEPGGINSTDAMLVISHFAQMQTLTGLYNKAADVDGNNFLNSLDALLIARYFTNSLSSFPAGQWIFDQVNFTIPTISSLYNVNGLCYGDVNGSYVPTLKAEPSVNMSLEGSIKVNLAETIEIPVTTDMNMHTNAISLVIEYPENDLRIEDVIMTNSAEPVLYTFNDGILRISWYSLNGMFINEGEPVFTIHAKPLSTLDVPYLSCTGNSEFADIFGTVAHNVKLRYPAIQISNESIHVNSMYPVPANDVITIQLELSIAESVVIEIYTNTGDLVSVEKLSKLEKGLNSVELNLSSVPAGSYICAIRTENQEYSKPVIRKKLLIIR